MIVNLTVQWLVSPGPYLSPGWRAGAGVQCAGTGRPRLLAGGASPMGIGEEAHQRPRQAAVKRQPHSGEHV